MAGGQALLILVDGQLSVGLAEGLDRLGLRSSELLGKPLAQALRAWPALVAGLRRASEDHPGTEVAPELGLQLDFRTVRDTAGRPTGALLVGLALEPAKPEIVRSTEARLLEAQRIAHVGSWEWDVEANKVHWSDELYRIYGIVPGQFGGTYEAFLEHVLVEDREHTRSVVFDAYRNGKSFVYDHRIVRPDGGIRMLHTRGEAITDSLHRVIRMVGSCWDTTDLWTATRNNERALSLLRATLESTADGLLVVDRQGKVVTNNQRLLEIWRLTTSIPMGMDFEELLARVHDQLENGDACLQRVRELQKQPESESFDSLYFRDGRYFERYSLPERIGTEIVGRVWSYRDVTERHRLLRGALFLSDASRLLASLDVEKALEAMAHVALTYFCDGCAIDIVNNGEPRRLLVLSRDPARSIVNELPHGLKSGKAAVHNLASTSYITVPLLGAGEVLGGLTFVAPGERRYTEADLETASELGRRAELAFENARLYRKAQDALSARDEFLAIAAHEIRGPLTSIHLAVQGLQRAPPGAATAKMLATIEREDRRLGRFVDELLDVSRMRAGALHFVFGQVDLVEVTREAASQLGAQLSRSGSSLSITAPGMLVGTWDRSRVEQIVTNLLSNAIKFGLGKPIELQLEERRGMAAIVVRDRGIGIPPEARGRVFAAFERASPRATTAAWG